MKKQTAVEWLVDQMDIKNPAWLKEKIQKAKQMEKEQMIEFATDTHNLNYYKNKSFRKEAEDYYNETYGGQDESK